MVKALITIEGGCSLPNSGLKPEDFDNIPYLALKGDYTPTSEACQTTVDAINARRASPAPDGSGEMKKNDMPIPQFRKLLAEKMKLLQIDDSFITRSVNDGFSGGEKKRLEILQMHMFQPRFAILDETDSGLDIDALKVVAEGIEALRSPDVGILLITHYERILRYVHPDFVHVLVDGRIVRTGGPELAAELESKGYEFVREALYAGRA